MLREALSVGTALVMFIGCGGGSSSSVPTTGKWKATASMITARYYHTSTVLPSGLVLVAGGNIDAGNGATANAELYDPVAGTWQAIRPMPGDPRLGHAAVLLPTGVLLVGGGHWNGSDTVLSASAVLYDPEAVTWSSAGSMTTPRWMETVTLLPSGKVLVAGGGLGYSTSADVAATKTAELYDPATNTWSNTGSMTTARLCATATLLPSGKVLVAGGAASNQGPGVASAELYDPASGTWTSTGPMPRPVADHSATLLGSGEVLVAGGYAGSAFDYGPIPRTGTALYDPASGTWSSAASMRQPHSLHGSALLASGKVLVVGGYGPTSAMGEAEVYEPATDTWEDTGAMSSLHQQSPGVTALANGQVLVTGGWYGASQVARKAAELFTE